MFRKEINKWTNRAQPTSSSSKNRNSSSKSKNSLSETTNLSRPNTRQTRLNSKNKPNAELTVTSPTNNKRGRGIPPKNYS